MENLGSSIRIGFDQAVANIITFAPKVLMFVVIIVAGYFIAKIACKVINAILERVRFDNLVERGGIKSALDRSQYDASDILAKLVFYAIFLFALQLAFGIFGPNPISALLTSVIAYLPNVFVAIVIVILASAIATGVKSILAASLSSFSYGRAISVAAAGLIVALGIFAALDQLNIAPAIVNGLFYACLAIVAGSAIVAIGGGGIEPMREQWNRAIDKIEAEGPQIAQHLQERPAGGRAIVPGDGQEVRSKRQHREA